MPDFSDLGLPADVAASEALVYDLLSISLTGMLLLRPVYAAHAAEIIDLEWVYLNPAAQRMLQHPAHPAASFLTLYPLAAQNGLFAFYRDTFLSGQVARRQNLYQGDSLDGYYLLVAQRHGALLLVSFDDTNAQPRTAVEEELRQSQAREQAARAEAEAARTAITSVFEQAPAMICIFSGPAHTFQFVNPPYQALVGARPLVGKPIAEAMPELAGQPIFELLDRVYQTGETFRATDMLVQLDHFNEGAQELEKRYYNFIYQARRDQNGAIDGILVFAYEVTTQVLARQQVQDLNEELAAINEELRASNEEYLLANTALSEVQQQLRHLNDHLEGLVQQRTHEAELAQAYAEAQQQNLHTIFEQAPVAIFVVRSAAYLVDSVNAPMCKLLGHSHEKLVGRPYFEVMPELVGQGFQDLLDKVWHTGQAHVSQEHPVQLSYHRPGELGYFSFIYQPVRNEHGQLTSIMCVALEVTDQVLARQQVQDLNEELAAINEELQATNEELHHTNTQLTRTNVDLDTFVYTASHDLKAPITNIEGLLLALQAYLPAAVQADEVIDQVLKLMQGAVERFRLTIDQLTDISRLQHAQDQPAEQVRLATVVEDVRLDLLPILHSAGGQLTIAIEPGLRVFFAPKNLRSVVYNLLSNAIKYQQPGRPPVVALRATHQEGRIVLVVQDNGLGLTPAQQQQLFGLFQRLHTHVEGTGVGLYMVKRLVENADGHITVQSQPGEGTTFTVSFHS